LASLRFCKPVTFRLAVKLVPAPTGTTESTFRYWTPFTVVNVVWRHFVQTGAVVGVAVIVGVSVGVNVGPPGVTVMVGVMVMVGVWVTVGVEVAVGSCSAIGWSSRELVFTGTSPALST
jgi:hypothetical protein